MRETLGYPSQSFGFHPRVSAERLLDHFAVLKGLVEPGVRRDVVESLLRRTNLWDVRRQRLGTFSGGMGQRFGVAVALLGSPKLSERHTSPPWPAVRNSRDALAAA